MAVEAQHLNLFPPRILSNRELMMNGVEGNGNVFGTQMTYGVVAPLSGITRATDTAVPPMYGSTFTDTVPAKTAAMKSDSGLTYAMPVSRKRSRDTINPLLSSFPNVVQNQNANSRSSFTFLGEDISFQIQQQQMEIDRFISQHTDKVRMEMEERRRRYSRRIAAAVEENIMKKLKAKEEEIEKIGKLNWALEERVKSLCVENQIWRDLAQTNETAANALRCDLEQVLAHVQDEQQQLLQCHRADEAALMDDAQSCCGSNLEEINPRTLADNASTGVRDLGCYNSHTKDGCIAPSGDKHGMINNRSDRMCRSCGKEESCVLLLPCRHLCLCTVCGSSLHTCPLCNSIKTASLHVNLSS